MKDSHVTKQVLAGVLGVTSWSGAAPANYIEALRIRLAQHDGCSRFGPKDSLLLRLYAEIPTAFANAKKALARDDSHDDIRDSLIALLAVLGEEMPDCSCNAGPNGHTDACPMHAWDKP